MPIQWAPNEKRVAEVGLRICERCKDVTPFTLCSSSLQFRFMFAVPLGSTNQKKFLLCEKCGGRWDVPEARALGLLHESKLLPSHQTAVAIWNALDIGLEAWLKDEALVSQGKNAAQILEVVAERLKSQLNPAHVDVIKAQYHEWLSRPAK